MSEKLVVKKSHKDTYVANEYSDIVSDYQIPIAFKDDTIDDGSLRVLSLFSGCGGMDLGFEGSFFANKRSFAENDPNITLKILDEWVKTKKTRFKTVFANDILPEAQIAWITYMQRFGYGEEVFQNNSIVDLVKMHKSGALIFPENIDVVTGGISMSRF